MRHKIGGVVCAPHRALCDGLNIRQCVLDAVIKFFEEKLSCLFCLVTFDCNGGKVCRHFDEFCIGGVRLSRLGKIKCKAS